MYFFEINGWTLEFDEESEVGLVKIYDADDNLMEAFAMHELGMFDRHNFTFLLEFLEN